MKLYSQYSALDSTQVDDFIKIHFLAMPGFPDIVGARKYRVYNLGESVVFYKDVLGGFVEIALLIVAKHRLSIMLEKPRWRIFQQELGGNRFDNDNISILAVDTRGIPIEQFDKYLNIR